MQNRSFKNSYSASKERCAAVHTRLEKFWTYPPPTVPSWADPVWHLYVIRHPQREKFQRRLLDSGIETGIHYPIPPHLQKAYSDAGFTKGNFPLSEKLSEEIISLPMCPSQSQEQTDYVLEKICALS